MREAGVSLAQVGLVIMLSRAAGFLVNFVFGDLLDRYHPRNIILTGELINLFITAGLIAVWPNVISLFSVFLVLVFVRSALIASVGPSQQKLIKLLFENNKTRQARAAVVLNLVNTGSLVITFVVSWFAIKHGSFTHMLIFDGVTFLFNVIAVFSLPHGSFPKSEKATYNIFKKFSHYGELQTGLVVKDILLHLGVFGTNILMIRLADNDVANVPLYLISFGCSVWISTFLIDRFTAARLAAVSWLLFPIPFLLMYLAKQSFILTFFAVFARNILYWNLYNHHSIQVQTLSPPTHTASIAAARSAIIMLILGCGELVMGHASQYLSLDNELIIRMTTCLLFSIYVYMGSMSFKARR